MEKGLYSSEGMDFIFGRSVSQIYAAFKIMCTLIKSSQNHLSVFASKPRGNNNLYWHIKSVSINA